MLELVLQASQGGTTLLSVVMIVFFCIFIIALCGIFSNKDEEKEPSHSQPRTTPEHHEKPIIQKSYWESYKEKHIDKANEIERLLEIDMSSLSDRNVKEKVEMLERFSKSMNCTISQLKGAYLKEINQYPDSLIPQMIVSTKHEMTNEMSLFHVSENNTCSALMIKWLQERLQSIPNNESYWESWKRQNPEKASALQTLTHLDFAQMEDEDVKQTIQSFSRAAEANGLSDWSQIKDYLLKKLNEMTKDCSEEEIILLLENLISQEVDYARIKPSNTASSYFKQWYVEYINSKDTISLSPEEVFRKEYRSKLINKIGSNARISLFCEGYDSPIAHEMMYLMYQHLRNRELKAEAERQDLWPKYMQIIIEETGKITEKYCHAALQECIEYYNFPDKKVITQYRCPECGSRQIVDSIDGFLCKECWNRWWAPRGINLYL